MEGLPEGISSRMVPGVNGLAMHVLEAGSPGAPAVLLLHGFPELAFSWRKVMLPLAAAGYHVVAPDQRGYGGTTGWDGAYDTDLRPFRLTNLALDALTLLAALGQRSAAVVGHDFGASVAAVCALTRPDVFSRMVLMSAPFTGPPGLPLGDAPADGVHAALAQLDRPRKHYQWYYSTREAHAEMARPPQGMHAFLRAYYHMKSADWPGNTPFELAGWRASELARMPTYYIMDLADGMPAAVAPHRPSDAEVAACEWLTERELAVYARAYEQTGFGGGLHWYRCRTQGVNGDLALWAGRTIDVPAAFIAGASDWGIRQTPGALERMQTAACSRMGECHLIPGAGHWVQQEQAAAVAGLLVDFLARHR
jgi:pimeloyl-ACP methyl ester carboxylesterase